MSQLIQLMKNSVWAITLWLGRVCWLSARNRCNLTETDASLSYFHHTRRACYHVTYARCGWMWEVTTTQVCSHNVCHCSSGSLCDRALVSVWHHSIKVNTVVSSLSVLIKASIRKTVNHRIHNEDSWYSNDKMLNGPRPSWHVGWCTQIWLTSAIVINYINLHWMYCVLNWNDSSNRTVLIKVQLWTPWWLTGYNCEWFVVSSPGSISCRLKQCS